MPTGPGMSLVFMVEIFHSYRTGDVVRANGMIKQHSQTLNDLGLSISRLFPAGTIIVTIAANIGETAIADYPVAFPDSLVGVTPTDINTNFLEYFLRTQKGRLTQFAPESAQKNINLEDPASVVNTATLAARAASHCSHVGRP